MAGAPTAQDRCAERLDRYLEGARRHFAGSLNHELHRSSTGPAAELEGHLTLLGVPFECGDAALGNRLRLHTDLGCIEISSTPADWLATWTWGVELGSGPESDRFCRELLDAHADAPGNARFEVGSDPEGGRVTVVARARIEPEGMTVERVTAGLTGVLSLAAQIADPIYPAARECHESPSRVPLAVAAAGPMPKLSPAAVAGFELIARWAQAVGAGRTLGDALDAVGRPDVPRGVAQAALAVREIPLARVTGAATATAFRQSFDALLARAGDQRSLHILQARLTFAPQTLETLAVAFGVTRERIRQIQKTAEDNIKTAARQDGFADVRWRAEELRRQLGTAIPLDDEHTSKHLHRLTEGLRQDQRELGQLLLLWLAGPYSHDNRTRWIFAGAAGDAGPPADERFISSCANSDGRIDSVVLESALAERGFVDAARAAWLVQEPHVRQMAASLYHWRGTVADKAETVLLALGEPATAEEINALIAQGHNLRGMRGRLLGDPRFMRTDLTRVGLRRWGLEEYTGIVDEIGEELDARGGEVPIADVVATVAQRFQLRAASVESYCGVPRFVACDGRLRRRRPDEPYMPRRTIVEEPGCYVLDEHRCTFGVRIDKEILRGSGRPLPQGLGAWLGILPGSRRVFRVENADGVLVSWPDSALMGPSLGSIRGPVLDGGGTDGDRALLTFNRTIDTLRVGVMSHEQLTAASGWRRIALLTGVSAADREDLEQRLAVAVGAPKPNQLRARLRQRGDTELLELLAAAPDRALDDALAALRGIL